MEKLADLSFGLSPQALAVATLLATRQPDFAEYDERLQTWLGHVATYPWYNGRERGVAFALRKNWACCKVLILVLAECRNSDAIFVEEWEQATLSNAPSIENRLRLLGEEGDRKVYKARWICGEGQIGKAADYIYERMARWYHQRQLSEKALEWRPFKALPGGKEA